MRNPVLRSVLLASMCGALIGCGDASRTEGTAAPEAAARPSVLNAGDSVQADGQTDAPEQDAAPTAEEDVAGDPPADADEPDEQVVDPPAADAPADEQVAEVPVADEPIAEVPVVEDPTDVVEDLPIPSVEDDPPPDPGTDSNVDPEPVDGLCAGVSNGWYCAVSLDPDADQSAIVGCADGVPQMSECPGKCDPAINRCQSGSGTGGSTSNKSNEACYRCLDSACEDERYACLEVPECSAAFPCLTTCDPDDANCVNYCNWGFAASGGGHWRACAIVSCSDDCGI